MNEYEDRVIIEDARSVLRPIWYWVVVAVGLALVSVAAVASAAV